MSADSLQNPITLTLKGQNGHAPLLEFLNACGAMRNCLKHVERCLFGDEESDEYDIADLRSSSAEVDIAPPNGSTRYPEIRQTFVGSVNNLQSGAPVDSRLDYAALRSFHQFCSPITRNAFLAVGGTVLTVSYIETIDKLLEPIHKSRGSVTGRLETISVHGQNSFVLYPSSRGEEITCVFLDKKLLPRVLAAVEKRLTVYGTLHFSLGRAYPTRVDVDDFDEHPPVDQLPSMLDLRGTITLNGPSEEIVRAIRNEWQ